MILFIVVAVCLCLFVTDIYGPGLANEEPINAAIAMKSIESSFRLSSGFFNLDFFSRIFPLYQSNPYMGALESYITLPFIMLFGVNVFAIRFPVMLVGLITIVLAYYFVREYFNRPVAMLTILLMTIQPCFLLFTKMATSDNVLNMIAMVCMLLFAKWTKTANKRYLFVLMFVLGVGLWAKIVFVWLIIGLAICGILFYRELLIENTVYDFTCAAGSFILGASPLIYANVFHKGETFSVIADSLLLPAQDFNNLHFVNNVLLRTKQFLRLMSGSDFDVFAPYKTIDVFDVFPYLFAISVIFLVIYLFKSHIRRLTRNIAVILILFSVIFIGLCFTVSCFRPKQLLLLVPFPHIIISLFIIYSVITISAKCSKKIWPTVSSCVVAALLFALVISDVKMLSAYRRADFVVMLKENSMSVYELADFLKMRGIKDIYVPADADKSRNLWFLMQGKLNIHEMSFDCDMPLLDNSKLYVLTYCDREVYSSSARKKFDIWNGLKNSLCITNNRVFRDFAGRDIYCFYEIN